MSDEAPREFSYPNSDHVSAVEKPAAAPATALTGNEQPKQQGQQPQQQVEQKSSQRGVGEGITEELRAYREQLRQEAPFFDPVSDYRDAGLEESYAAEGIIGDQARTLIAEDKRVFADLNLSTAEAREAVSLLGQYTNNPPDEQTEAQWVRESWSALVRQHGATEAAAMLRDAQRLVAMNPDLVERLEISRTGSHPKVVSKLCSVARSLRAKGWLK